MFLHKKQKKSIKVAKLAKFNNCKIISQSFDWEYSSGRCGIKFFDEQFLHSQKFKNLFISGPIQILPVSFKVQKDKLGRGVARKYKHKKLVGSSPVVQWVKDLGLLQLWYRSQLLLGFHPWPRTSTCHGCSQEKKRIVVHIYILYQSNEISSEYSGIMDNRILWLIRVSFHINHIDDCSKKKSLFSGYWLSISLRAETRDQ